MAKVFYDHLIVLEDIRVELAKYDVEALEIDELVTLADQTLHHHTLDIILTNLPSEKHETFLKEFHKRPHDRKLLDFLKLEAGEDIEKKIKDEADRVKKEILAEIKRARRKS